MIHRDRIGDVILKSSVSTSRPISSPMPIASNWPCTSPKTVAKSMLVLPVIMPALCWTICCPSSNIAIVISKVCVTR